jgi:hypothetical protein
VQRRALGSLAVAVALTLFAADALAYNFIGFGGRQGRQGVTDSSYTWDIGASGGTISWYFQRDQLTVDPGDGSGQATAAEFAAMKARIQPELDKWGLWLDVTFVEAASAAAADVVIEFETTFDVTGFAVPTQGSGGNQQGAAAVYGATTGATLDTAEIGLYPSNHWADDLDDFSFVILHEWGHILGLGDLYLGGANAGEDFVDHNKTDSVMNTRGVLTLDNDEIAGAQWLIGGLGNNSLVTGKLNAIGANPVTQVAAHHGPTTWTYRGTSTVAAGGPNGTTVVIDALGATAARSVGGGTWTITINPYNVIFKSGAGFAGNFIFEIDSNNPEGYIDASVADLGGATDFTQTPAAGGPQYYPQVYGPVPEPATAALLAAGLLGLGSLGRRRASR